MTAVIREIRAQTQAAILVIDHNLRHVSKLCSEAIVLNRGRLIAHGHTDEIFDRPEVRNISIGL